MPKSTITNITATWVRSGASYAKKNLFAEKRIVIRATGGEGGIGLLWFSLPAPRGATYKSAKLRLYNSAAMVGAETMYLNRVTQGWSAEKVTYATRPSFTTTGRKSVSKTNAPKNSVWEYDITAFLNAASNSETPWYGFALTSSASTVWRYFYHPRGAVTQYVPVIEVEWYENPRAPQDLTPSELRYISTTKPILQCDYFDINGENTIAAIQVQLSNDIVFPGTGPGWFDSGEVPTDEPQLDLNDYAYTLVTGTVYAWRVRVKDNTDLWSDWSDIETFIVSAKPTVQINSPGPPPNNYVEESTPTFLWQVTSGVQKAWQALVWNEDKTELIWDSSKLTGTQDSVTLTPFLWGGLSGGVQGTIDQGLEEAGTYHLELRIWDDKNRATLQNDPAYVTVEREFEFIPYNGTNPVDSLTVVNYPNTPWALLEFTRGTAPDYFEILRDGKSIANNLDPSDLDVSPGVYRWVDRTATPRRPHKWSVRSIVNSQASANNPELTTTIRPRVCYLCSEDGSLVIPILNADPKLTPVSDGTFITAKNSPEAITVYMGGGGRTGTFSGVITGDIGGQTALTYLNRLLTLREKKNLGKPMILTYLDQSVRCVLSNIFSEPIGWSDSVGYAVSFSLSERIG